MHVLQRRKTMRPFGWCFWRVSLWYSVFIVNSLSHLFCLRKLNKVKHIPLWRSRIILNRKHKILHLISGIKGYILYCYQNSLFIKLGLTINSLCVKNLKFDQNHWVFNKSSAYVWATFSALVFKSFVYHCSYWIESKRLECGKVLRNSIDFQVFRIQKTSIILFDGFWSHSSAMFLLIIY
jgi:hypothetical protein